MIPTLLYTSFTELKGGSSCITCQIARTATSSDIRTQHVPKKSSWRVDGVEEREQHSGTINIENFQNFRSMATEGVHSIQNNHRGSCLPDLEQERCSDISKGLYKECLVQERRAARILAMMCVVILTFAHHSSSGDAAGATCPMQGHEYFKELMQTASSSAASPLAKVLFPDPMIPRRTSLSICYPNALSTNHSRRQGFTTDKLYSSWHIQLTSFACIFSLSLQRHFETLSTPSQRLHIDGNPNLPRISGEVARLGA